MVSAFDNIEVRCGSLGLRGSLRSRVKDMLAINDVALGPDMDFDQFDRLGHGEVLAFDYLFVNIDAMGGIVHVFDRLAALRIRHPSLPVIMISAEFETDDFDTTRRALGDVSLRIPVVLASLEAALFEALGNNRQWRESVTQYRWDLAA